MKKSRIAIIGGTLFYGVSLDGIQTRIGTPYGPSPTLTILRMGGKNVIFSPRHGEKPALPPVKVLKETIVNIPKKKMFMF